MVLSGPRSVLRDLRRAAGLTLRDVSKGSGWSPATLCRIEIGKRQATPEEIAGLAALYMNSLIADLIADYEATIKQRVLTDIAGHVDRATTASQGLRPSPDTPFATLLDIAETYCHPEAWEGAYEQLRRLARERPDDPEMVRLKNELRAAIVDPSQVPHDDLFHAAEYDDGSGEKFLTRLWHDLYPDEEHPALTEVQRLTVLYPEQPWLGEPERIGVDEVRKSAAEAYPMVDWPDELRDADRSDLLKVIATLTDLRNGWRLAGADFAAGAGGTDITPYVRALRIALAHTHLNITDVMDERIAHELGRGDLIGLDSGADDTDGDDS